MAGGGLSLFDGHPFSTPLSLLLLQAALIISIARLLNLVLRNFSTPLVISEMLAGIVLGPSVLGQVPGFTDGNV